MTIRLSYVTDAQRFLKTLFTLAIFCVILLGLSLNGSIAAEPHGLEPGLSTRPHRIVSLAPNLTEILFAVGLDREVVGVTPYCNFPPAAQTRAKVGGLINPNLESVVHLRPDLVMAVAGFNPPESLNTLRRLGIPVLELEFNTLEDVDRRILDIGRATGREDTARSVVARMTSRRAALARGLTASPKRPRVLYLVSDGPLMTVGPGSFIHEMILAAGGENIMGDARTPYPLMNIEEVLSRNPEVILFSSEMGKPADQIQGQWQRWPQVAAVAAHRLYPVDADLVNRPGPRLVEGMELLNRIFYGKNTHP